MIFEDCKRMLMMGQQFTMKLIMKFMIFLYFNLGTFRAVKNHAFFTKIDCLFEYISFAAITNVANSFLSL
jgi:hypothetical protein